MANGLFAGGDGTPQNPYLIEDALDLDAMRNNLSAHYKLIANIDLDINPYNEGEGWIPIGSSASIFLGFLDGNNHSISNLFINRPLDNYQGLFGYVNGVYSRQDVGIQNLSVVNANVTGQSVVGILSGTIGYIAMTNIHTSGNIVALSTVGGIAGSYNSNGSSARKLSSSANVQGGSGVGGLFSSTNSIQISNSYSTGDVTATSHTIGGLIGSLGAVSSIDNCYSKGKVTSSGAWSGGLVGRLDRNSASANNFWDTETSGKSTSAIGTGLTTAQMKTSSSYVNWDKALSADGTKIWYLFDGYYPMFENPFYYKVLVKHNNTFKKYHSKSWVNVSPSPTEQDYIDNGINKKDLSFVPQSAWEQLDGDFEVCLYTDDVSFEESSCVTEVEPFSVYDYIGELPEVLVYTESTDDIIVSTTTEPFDIYEELGEEVEVLYYTDDKSVNEADLILEANWSPVDELEGDVEIVTWTDEAPDTAQRVLEMKAVPKPQFVKLVNPKRIYGNLDNVLVEDISSAYRHETRYFVGGENSSRWSVWDKEQNKFVVKDASTEELISSNGMTHEELNDITNAQWKTWKEKHLNIGVFLKDNIRDTIVSVVDTVSYEDYLPRYTPTVKDASFYILNTTAKIDIAFNGNVLKGILADDDLSRVQYRVLLNNNSYYPSDGSFTKLGESPQNIEVAVSSKDIKIDDWNTIKIEFQDFFGTVDFWQTSFIGTYSGLMFKDIFGQYYSSEIGEVLQYLDFGIIIAGQTTIEHEVLLKNQYGYDVKNVHLSANTSKFPQGMTCEFSTSSSPFTPQPELILSGVLKNNEEMSFFIRLKTELGATPDVNGSFDIIVRADEV